MSLPCSALLRPRYRELAMTGFSVVAVFLIGGFGIFFGLSRAAAPWYVTLLVALAWTALLIWLWLVNRADRDP
jgi:hypothetical protein